MQGNVLGQSGSTLKINGIIEEYKVASGGNVRAGDFVKYINEVANQKTKVCDYPTNNSLVQAAEISPNKVLILHNYKYTSSSLTYDYLYGIVCTVEETGITAGKDTQLIDDGHASWSVSMVVLEDNKVFISHSSDRTASWSLWGLVCTINGTTITKGTDTKIDTTNYSGTEVSSVKLSENKVAILHGKDGILSGAYLSIAICTVDGTTITLKTNGKKLDTVNTGDNISSIALSENKILVIHSYGSNNYLYYTILEIDSSNKATVAKSDLLVDINLGNYEHNIYSILLSNRKLLIVHGDTNKYLYGLVCTIDNEMSELTPGIDTMLYSDSKVGEGILQPIVILGDNKVSIIHYLDEGYSMYNTICTINGMSITVETAVKLVDLTYGAYSKISSIMLNNNYICISYGAKQSSLSSSNANLYVLAISNINYGLQIVNSSIDKILGIARTKGIEGQTVKVYIPKLPEYICTEDKNRIITENGEEIRNE